MSDIRETMVDTSFVEEFAAYLLKEHGIRAWVVDDDEASREMMLEALRRSGYRLRSANSAERALAILEKEPADLVVTDVQMGGMSGIELVLLVLADRG